MSMVLKATNTPALTPEEWQAVREYLMVAATHMRQVAHPLGVKLSGPLAQRMNKYADHAEQLKDKLWIE